MTKDYKLLRSVIMLNHRNGQPQKNNATALSAVTGMNHKRIMEMIVNMKNIGTVDFHCGIAYPILDTYGNMKDLNDNIKAVVGINKKTGNQIRFGSAYEAAGFLNIKRSNISACCNCRYGRKSTGGYKWRFEYDT